MAASWRRQAGQHRAARGLRRARLPRTRRAPLYGAYLLPWRPLLCLRLPRRLLPWRLLLRLRAGLLLRSGILRLGLQSLGCAGSLLVGLGRSAVVRILRILLQSVSGLRHGSVVDDGLCNQPELAGRL